MPHVGRLYPVMFRRDLTLILEYPILLPDRWIWASDDFTWSSDPSKARIGTPSTHAAVNALGDETTWEFPFASGTLIECKLTARYRIKANRREVEWYFRAEDNSQPGFADTTIDGVCCLNSYPIQFNTIGFGPITDWAPHGGYTGGPHKFGNMDWSMNPKLWP
jgi:hypothetical protein